MAVNLHFYSDLLCYWGWIGQHVNDQIRGNWSQEEVVWHYHCLPVYANIPERMAQTAPGDEGYLAFADKTENSLASFDGIDINPVVWRQVRPRSSIIPHQIVKAVYAVEGPAAAVELARAIRHAFFEQARDVSEMDVLREILQENELMTLPVMQYLKCGQALADVFSDFKVAKKEKVPGNPTWIMDGGRYRFYGNIDINNLVFVIDSLVAKQ